MKKPVLILGGAVTTLVMIAGTATAASLIHSGDIAPGGVHRVNLSASINRDLTTHVPGPVGPQGLNGADGSQGLKGDKGANGLAGTYYALAKYDVGDTNGGAIATVACSNPTDVAISGGVRTIGLGTNGIGNNVPVSSSFPGRMDWSTNTPKDGRLDGWIVQFGAETGSAPKYVDIYALCVPGANVPVVTTYTESS